MKKKELLDWFDEIEAERDQGFGATDGFAHYKQHEKVTAWLTDARSALGAAFPPRHKLLEQWDSLMGLAAAQRGLDFASYVSTVKSAAGIFMSAHRQVKAGRLGSLIDGVKAETVAEILDQADQLVAANHLIAATVLAGGALETHLLHLCQRAGLTWSGHGSIGKYNDAIAQARSGGNEIYSATDGKQVTTWGGHRNDAAHKPATFSGTAAEVRIMIDGIRHFIAKVP